MNLGFFSCCHVLKSYPLSMIATTEVKIKALFIMSFPGTSNKPQANTWTKHILLFHNHGKWCQVGLTLSKLKSHNLKVVKNVEGDKQKKSFHVFSVAAFIFIFFFQEQTYKVLNSLTFHSAVRKIFHL